MKTKKTNNQFAAAQKTADKKADQIRTVDQQMLLQKVQDALDADGIPVNLYMIQKIIQAEQQVCTSLLSGGAKIVMWNYLTLYTSAMPPRKLKCPLDGKTYDVPETVRVNVRIGEGLRKAVQKVDPSNGGKNGSQTVRKTSERTRLYADRFVKKSGDATDADTTPGDKKRSEAQRPGTGQTGGKARAKRAETDTAAATGAGGVG